MYQVIGPIRTRTLRVLWTLEELGQDYTHTAAAPHAEQVVTFNPAGKVPVLVSGGVPITDSIAIMTYLSDKHGALTHAPGTIARARQDSLTHFLSDELDQVLWMASRHSFILPENMRLPEIKESLRWEFARNLKRLVARMAEDGPFLMGAEMTIADIVLAHCLIWAENAKFPVEEDRLLAFRDLMQARPAYARATGER